MNFYFFPFGKLFDLLSSTDNDEYLRKLFQIEEDVDEWRRQMEQKKNLEEFFEKFFIGTTNKLYEEYESLENLPLVKEEVEIINGMRKTTKTYSNENNTRIETTYVPDEKPEDNITSLENELKKAVADENYELAAVLKKKIAELKSE